MKKAIENYKDDSFIELGVVVNGEVFVCLDENTNVTITDADEGGDIAGIIDINIDEENMERAKKAKSFIAELKERGIYDEMPSKAKEFLDGLTNLS